MSTLSTCRGCGKAIVWGITDDGKRIPLDPRPATYMLKGPWDLAGDQAIARAPTTFVTHFATCVAADQFSASKKTKGPG